MERSSEDIDEEKASEIKEPLLAKTSSKGGFTTLPFILANEGFERAASCGLEPNMIVYLMGGYGLEMATGANIIFLWNAATNFTPILGAFLADTFVGRFRMIGFGSILSLMDPRQELTPEDAVVNPWHLCTVDQVEEFKSILKLIPLWSTGIMLGVNANQTSFRVLQANSMDRHIISCFEIPAGSFGTFSLITVILWLVLYDRVIIPLASRAKGKSTCLDTKTRMGIGFLLSILSLVVAAVVESVRRDRAIDPSSGKMSALWLVPQISLLGLSEALCAIAQIEFFYSEFPRSMSSISSNLWGLSMGFASLVASLIMNLVDHVTKRYAEQSWVSGDVNKGHYDYYYGVLAGLGLLNYVYFLVCSRAYWQDKKVSHDAKEISDK